MPGWGMNPAGPMAFPPWFNAGSKPPGPVGPQAGPQGPPMQMTPQGPMPSLPPAAFDPNWQPEGRPFDPSQFDPSQLHDYGARNAGLQPANGGGLQAPGMQMSPGMPTALPPGFNPNAPGQGGYQGQGGMGHNITPPGYVPSQGGAPQGYGIGPNVGNGTLQGTRAQEQLAEQLRQQIPWLRNAPDQSPDSIVGAAQAYAQANPDSPLAGVLGRFGNPYGNPNAPTAPNRGAKPATARQQVNGDYAAMSQGPAQTGSRSFPGMRDGYPTSNAQAPQGQPPAQPQQDRSMRPVVGYDNYRQDLVRREQQRLGVGPYAPPQAPAPPATETPPINPAPTSEDKPKPAMPPPRWGTYDPTGARPGQGNAPGGPLTRPRPTGGAGPVTETPPIVPQQADKLNGRWDGKYQTEKAQKPGGSSIKNAEKQVAMRRAANAKRR